MCLYSKQILPRRATKDITVYKVVCKLLNCVYQTPFKGFLIHENHFGKVITDEKPKHIVREDIFIRRPSLRRLGTGVTMVESGYFHACQTPEDAYNFCLRNLLYKALILKCTIPKGALYWKGTSGDICSNKIIFNSVYHNSPLQTCT